MEKGAARVDRRVTRTKKAIKNSLAQLLTVKDLNDITIKDIAELAEINRKTFYNYYDGIRQIVDEIENELVGIFEAELKIIDFKEALNAPYAIFERLSSIINSDMDFYSHLMKMSGNVNLMTKIVALLKTMVRDMFSSQIEIDREQLEIMVEFTISGMIAVYQNWFNSDRHQSIEEISQIISVMCFRGVNGIVDLPGQT